MYIHYLVRHGVFFFTRHTQNRLVEEQPRQLGPTVQFDSGLFGISKDSAKLRPLGKLQDFHMLWPKLSGEYSDTWVARVHHGLTQLKIHLIDWGWSHKSQRSSFQIPSDILGHQNRHELCWVDMNLKCRRIRIKDSGLDWTRFTIPSLVA